MKERERVEENKSHKARKEKRSEGNKGGREKSFQVIGLWEK